MTVGNLYRYYQNKEDLSNSVIEETLSVFRDMLKDLKVENVEKELRVFDTRPQMEQINRMIGVLSERLSALYETSRDELNIIMMNPRVGKELTLWFHSLISNISDGYDRTAQEKKERNTLMKTYAIAMHAGVREMIRNHDGDAASLKRLLNAYLGSYAAMLNGRVDLSRE